MKKYTWRAIVFNPYNIIGAAVIAAILMAVNTDTTFVMGCCIWGLLIIIGVIEIIYALIINPIRNLKKKRMRKSTYDYLFLQEEQKVSNSYGNKTVIIYMTENKGEFKVVCMIDGKVVGSHVTNNFDTAFEYFYNVKTLQP